MALARNHLSRSKPQQLDAFLQMFDKVAGKVREHRYPAQMIFQRAFAVVLIHLCPKRLVLEHDVQNVAQHFVRHHVRVSSYRCRPRIKVHARHFAEQISCSQLSHRIVVA